MRAIHSVNSLRADHGGPSRSVTAVCSGLAQHGVDMGIVTRQRQPDEPPPVLPADAHVEVHFVEPEAGWRAFLPGAGRFETAIRAAVGERGLVHDHGLWLPTNHAAARAARRAGAPFVVSTRGMLTEWALQFNAAKKKVAWALYQRRDLESAALFHATAEEEVEDIRRAGLRQPIALVPNGVEIPDRRRGEPADGGPRKALFLSRVHPKKGLINLVHAWAEVGPEGWELVIAGPDEGGHRAEVEAAIRALGLDGVTWTGEVDDRSKWDLYYDADLFVLPTFSENFGIVVAEALAAGIPAITTTGAPWAVLEERGCGWWIDTGREPLAVALAEATSMSDERRLEMGRRGRTYVEEELSWAHVAAEMRAAYAWLMDEGPRPNNVVLE